MNKRFRITLLSVLVPAMLVLLLFQGCKKDSDPSGPAPQDAALWLKGVVVDAATHAGIANATVYIGTTVLTTDAGGRYSADCKSLGLGTYDVRVKAAGYGYGFASAQVNQSAAMVNTIALKPLEEPSTVGAAGGLVMVYDNESLIPASQDFLIIPAGAFNSDVHVSLTRFTGADVPGYAPAGMLNLCAINLSPAATIPAVPVELRFALPFNGIEINTLPLLRYDFETNTWSNTGLSAVVNGSENTATVQVQEFGTYSLAVTGSFTETNGTSGASATRDLNPAQSSVDLKYLASNEYAGGVPPTICAAYLKNLASQNTRLNGIRVSFSDSTTCIFNYIGTKPDSLAPVKSTMTGYYRWSPRVSNATREMPVTITLRDVSVAGTIVKEVFTDVSAWQYVHDQGGGGK
jgi:hypothetical protein